MTWEAVTAIATAFTGLVIAATVVVGARQLELTRATLDHLRRATQLEGAMKILDDLNEPEFRDARLFVRNDLNERMKDPQFAREVRSVGLSEPSVHKELTVLREFERIGVYVKNGLMEGTIIYDVAVPLIIATWEAMADIVAIHREVGGNGLWENFEFLYNGSKSYVAARGGAKYLTIGLVKKPSSSRGES